MPITKYAKDQPAGFTNRIERIAITGAAGQFGKHITHALLQTGQHTVTAITRPSTQPPNLPPGVHISTIDYSLADDPATFTTLVDILRPQQALIITLSVHAPRTTLSLLLRAAAAANVPYVFPNWSGHDPANDALCRDSLLLASRDALLEEITSLGVSSYILLACSFWYEFSLGGGAHRYGFDFKDRSLVWFDDGDVRIDTTTWPQCGRAIASVLSLKELPEDEGDESLTVARYANGTIYVSSFCVNQREMFESVKRVTGTEESEWTVTRESAAERWRVAREGVERGDWAGFTKQLYSRMFVPTGDGVFGDGKVDNERLGLPREDLDEWTRVAVGMGESGAVVKTHRG